MGTIQLAISKLQITLNWQLAINNSTTGLRPNCYSPIVTSLPFVNRESLIFLGGVR